MRTGDVFRFALERERVRLLRARGASSPWTDDPILREFRFCNVYREYDTVTAWLREEWREPHHDDPDLWFAHVVARHVNNVPTLAAFGGPPLPWSRDLFLETMLGRKARGEKTFSPAYMISTNGREVENKAVYLADYVFGPMWQQREGLRPRVGDTLTSYHVLLGQLYGLASFLAAQVIADVKYVEPLLGATDWSTFAASGPGSRRGLNRVLGRDKSTPWREDEWRLALARLRAELLPMFREAEMPEPHGQDVQNVLCEFDKYERVRLGEGRPKQLFRSST